MRGASLAPETPRPVPVVLAPRRLTHGFDVMRLRHLQPVDPALVAPDREHSNDQEHHERREDRDGDPQACRLGLKLREPLGDLVRHFRLAVYHT